MKLFNIFFVYITITLCSSSLFATERTEFGFDFEAARRSIEKYDLLLDNYTESILEHLKTAHQSVSEKLDKLNGKKLGIVIGENHSSEGTKCFEMFILHLAKSAGISLCLAELSDKRLETVMAHGYKMGQQYGFLQRLLKEAQNQEMRVVPIDPDIEKEASDSSMQIKEFFINLKKREGIFVEKIIELEDSFVFYTGVYHLASFYYSKRLSEKFLRIRLSHNVLLLHIFTGAFDTTNLSVSQADLKNSKSQYGN